jgi:hypothetical protein
MAYIDQTILEDSLGVSVVAELTGSDADTLTRLIAHASARVRTALQIGGYTAAVPETVYASNASDCPAEIVELTSRVWKRIAYARRDLSIPEDQIREIDAELADLREGRIEIKGLTRATTRAPGGIDRTETSTSVTVANGSRPQIFSRTRMTGW